MQNRAVPEDSPICLCFKLVFQYCSKLFNIITRIIFSPKRAVIPFYLRITAVQGNPRDRTAKRNRAALHRHKAFAAYHEQPGLLQAFRKEEVPLEPHHIVVKFPLHLLLGRRGYKDAGRISHILGVTEGSFAIGFVAAISIKQSLALRIKLIYSSENARRWSFRPDRRFPSGAFGTVLHDFHGQSGR